MQEPVVKPAFLVGRPAGIWSEVTPSLVERGFVGPLDAHLLSAWCMLASELESGGLGCGRLAQFRALSASFGMTPEARARLGTRPDSSEHDLAEAYFGA